jgi:hypothetical protein
MQLHFSPAIRLIFFLILAVFFVITSATLIAYGFGYRYNFERGIFIHSGSLTIKANPARVNISVDDKVIDRKKLNFINGSYQIDGLRPGTHRVSVSADSFQAWTKTFTVESGKSTEFWNILLPRESYAVETTDIRNITGIFPSPDGRRLAIATESNNELSVFVADAQTLSAERVFSSLQYRRIPNWRANIEWSPNSTYLLIPVMHRPEILESDESLLRNDTFAKPNDLFLVNIATTDSETLFSDRQFPPIHSVRWGKSSDTLFGLSIEGNILRYDYSDNQWQSSIIADNVAAYDISGSRIFFVQTNGILYQSEFDGSEKEQLSTTQPEQFPLDMSLTLIAYDSDRAVALSSSGNLYIWNRGERGTFLHKIDSVSGAQFSNDGKKILFWGDAFIRAYFTREWDVQPRREENTFLDIANFVSPITNVGWVKNYEHILFVSDRSMRVTELDHRDRRITTTLSPTISESPIILQRFNENEILFTSPHDTFSNTLSRFTFPETNGLFGIGE